MSTREPQEPSPKALSSIEFEGELDLANVGELEVRLRDAEGEGARVILLDLRKVTFIDSSGLRLILGAEARARGSGRRLVLVRAPQRVQRIFTLTKLDEKLEFVDHPSLLEVPPATA
jgi:stage II sporulation protein AA (anti-sigma F factor antagonist)